MITKTYRRLLIGLSFIICHLSFSVVLTSCADYNETNNFSADPDPSYVEPYKDLNAVKSYINREQYPNLTLGAMLKVSEFNKQELAHAAAMTNFRSHHQRERCDELPGYEGPAGSCAGNRW